jgi:hypothetical protein
MIADCPNCSIELTSKTEARTTSSMWSYWIRQAEKNQEAVVGVCYPCGELFDLSAFINQPEVYERLHRHVFSARSLGQRLRHEAKAIYDSQRVPMWTGQTFEQWVKQSEHQMEMAKHQARKQFIERELEKD